jgi:D-alanyl-D-alanine carboxypeptidase
MRTSFRMCNGVGFALVLLSGPLAVAQSAMAPEMRARIDGAAEQVLSSTGVPSASVAIVQDGRVVYLRAYGNARLESRVAATAGMRYSVGSISKQFTATAILMLAEQGKLSLDDPVARFIPDLTRANEVTIRQVLSHTSGYQDYWPQDYVPPFMLQAVTANKILDLWARKPLDFDPGTQWQYSNTGYVIAGLIVERASSTPLLEFLSKHIFEPLGMKSVMNIDQERLAETDATGYTRYGLGPQRIAPKEGKGWLFAAGELAMPAEDLAKWDISIMNQTLLKPASYQQFETSIVLKNGIATNYALGIGVRRDYSRRVLEHGGEVSGFTSDNLVFPDDHAAVVVLTNEDAVDASDQIAQRVATLLFPEEDSAKDEAQARAILEGLQKGEINRASFSDNANAYFSEQALKDLATGLGPLGAPHSFTQSRHSERGGMTFRLFIAKFAKQNLQVWQRTLPDGKIEQYQVMAAE